MTARTLNNPLVVWAGDIHCNSTVAVAPPESEVNDEVTVTQSKAQKALWDAWKDAWAQIKSKKRNVVLVLGGEICDIDAKKRSDQMITQNPDKAQGNAMTLLGPALEVATRIIILRGTEAHSGKSAWTDEGIAKAIHKECNNVYRNGKQFSWWECEVYIGGRFFNLAHHTVMGRVPRSERDAANHLSADLMMSYGRSKRKLPDYAMRGHVHRVSESGMNFPVRSIVCPCWQLQTTHIHRLGEGSKDPEIGLITVDPAKNEVEWIRYEPKREEPGLI